MKKICFLLLLIMLTFLISLPLFAGTTGKIRGVIKDKANGDPLPGVNVVITHVWRFGKAVKLTTPLGAATNLNGEFIILQVPPGIYSVTAKMMGYTNKVQQHVQVFIDRTTTINFTLPSIVLDLGKSVVVEAKRDVVQLDVASTENYISEEDYKELKERYRRDALLILKEIDEVREGKSMDNIMEKEVLARRKPHSLSGEIGEREKLENSEDADSFIEKEILARRKSLSFCPHCGFKCDKSSKFCSQCGRELK